jgi:O-antigen/teichoic acid export membrane protein
MRARWARLIGHTGSSHIHDRSMTGNRNMVANYFGQAWIALMQLAFVPIYIRYLGLESYGLIGVFAILQACLTIVDLGMTPTLNREMARHMAGAHTPQSIQNLLRSLEIVCWTLAFLLVVVIGLSAGWVSQHWLRPDRLTANTVSDAITIMGVAATLRFVQSIYQGALLGLQHQVWLSAFNAAFATIRAVGSLMTLLYISPTISGFLLFQCCVSLVEVVVLARHVRRRLPKAVMAPRFSMHAIRGVWNFAAGLTVIALLSLLLMQADKILLATLLPLSEYGYFTLAVTATGVLALMILPVYNVAYPRLTELVTSLDRVALAREYHRFSQLLAITVLPTALVFYVFSKEIVFLWTRDAVTTQVVAPILSVWVLGSALNGLMHIPYAAQLAHGWSKLTIVVNSVAVLLSMPALIFFVPRHGAIAAAWIWVAINGTYTLVVIGAMHTRILQHEKWRWYAQDVLAPLLASGIAVAAMMLIYRSEVEMSLFGQVLLLSVGLLGSMFCAACATSAGLDAIKSTARMLFQTKSLQ